MLGDKHATAVLIQLGAVNSWSHAKDLYKIHVDIKKLKKKCPFRNAIQAICFGGNKRRSIKYLKGTIVLFRTPNWDDHCTPILSWDDPCTKV